MTTFRLFIGTTDGPTEVQRITPEDPEVRSVVCLDGRAVALPISDDYDAFVRRPTGVIEALTGHGAYRVDISHPIGCGYSWQLGILAAHMVTARGGLAGPDDAPRDAVWLTGEVDHRLNVGAVEDVSLKLMRATSALKGLIAGGLRVTVVVPEACAEEASAALAQAFPGAQARPRLIAARHFDDVLPALGLKRPRRLFKRAGSGLAGVRRGRRAAVFSGALAVVATVLVAAWPLAGPPDRGRDDAAGSGPGTLAAGPEGAPPRIALIETRAPAGEGCAAVDFQRARPAIARHLFPSAKGGGDTGEVRPVKTLGLCDLHHRIVNPGLGALAVTAVATRYDESGGRFRTRTLASGRRLAPGGTLDLDARPPREVSVPLVQRLVVLALPEGWPRAAERLERAARSLTGAASPESWARAVAELGADALFLSTAGQIFVPEWAMTEKTGQALP